MGQSEPLAQSRAHSIPLKKIARPKCRILAKVWFERKKVVVVAGVDLTTDFRVMSAQCGALRLGYTIAISARDHLALGMSRYLAVLEFSFFPYAGLLHAKRLLVEIVPGCRE